MSDTICFEPITKNTRFRLRDDARKPQPPWRWPLARLGNRDPLVLAEHVSDTRQGVDLGYVVAPFDTELFVPVSAAQSGEISFAMEAADGFTITIDHGSTTTLYAHLSKMFVRQTPPRLRRRECISAGDVIGYAERAPLHIRFEVWERRMSGGFECVDARPYLEQWTIPSPANELRRKPGKAA